MHYSLRNWWKCGKTAHLAMLMNIPGSSPLSGAAPKSNGFSLGPFPILSTQFCWNPSRAFCVNLHPNQPTNRSENRSSLLKLLMGANLEGAGWPEEDANNKPCNTKKVEAVVWYFCVCYVVKLPQEPLKLELTKRKCAFLPLDERKKTALLVFALYYPFFSCFIQ